MRKPTQKQWDDWQRYGIVSTSSKARHLRLVQPSKEIKTTSKALVDKNGREINSWSPKIISNSLEARTPSKTLLNCAMPWWISGSSSGAAGFSGPDILKYFEFDGSNEYLRIGDFASINPDENTPFSISAIVRPGAVITGNRQILSNQIGASNYSGYRLMISGGKINFGIINTWNSAGNYISIDSDSQYLFASSGDWSWITVTYAGDGDATNCRIYHNGSSVAFTEVGETLTSDPKTSGGTDVCRWPNGGSGGNYFDGDVAQLIYHGKAISSSEHDDMYALGTFVNWKSLSTSGNTVAHYLMGDDALDDATGTTGTIIDQSSNGLDGTPFNTESGDIKTI